MLKAVRRSLVGLARRAGMTAHTTEIPAYYLPYVFLDGLASVAPLQCDFEITYRCNMYCRMCPQVAYRASALDGAQITASPVDGDRQELDTAQVRRAVSRLAEGGTRLVLFSGGEPFLRRDLLEILAHAKGLGLDLHVITNGSMITPAIARSLVEIGVDGMTFSLDGPEREHDEIRHLPRSFQRLTAGIGAVREARDQAGRDRPRLSFSAVIHALNQHALADLVAVAHRHGIVHVNYNYLFFTTPAQEAATRRLVETGEVHVGVKPEDQVIPDGLRRIDVALLQAQIEETRRRGRDLGVSVTFEPEHRREEVQRRFGDPAFSTVHRCFYPWKAMRIDAWGNAYPCSVDVHLGNIKRDDILAIWNGPRYRHFRRTLKAEGLLPQCAKCCVLTDRTWDRLPAVSLPLPHRLTPVLQRAHRLARV